MNRQMAEVTGTVRWRSLRCPCGRPLEIAQTAEGYALAHFERVCSAVIHGPTLEAVMEEFLTNGLPPFKTTDGKSMAER